eukprot:GHRR01019458.1.p1 GENE.GHRR01019458.1~~GHRR01019458.1.p1  ORF type:complete len:275 (+),score=86.36 GHRR01019458.1:453-1277(+)
MLRVHIGLACQVVPFDTFACLTPSCVGLPQQWLAQSHNGVYCLLQALAGRHYNEQLHGLLTAAGTTSGLVEAAQRTLVIHEASSAATPDDPILDLSQLDVVAAMFDSAEPATFRHALKLIVGLSGKAGESLPFVLIAAKDDLGMSKELEAEVYAACHDLSIPLPIPVSVLLGSLGHSSNDAAAATGSGSNVFVSLLLAALHPEGYIPDTPARKARRQTIRKVMLTSGFLVTSIASMYAAYRIYKSVAAAQSNSSASGSSGRKSSRLQALLGAKQ